MTDQYEDGNALRDGKSALYACNEAIRIMTEKSDSLVYPCEPVAPISYGEFRTFIFTGWFRKISRILLIGVALTMTIYALIEVLKMEEPKMYVLVFICGALVGMALAYIANRISIVLTLVFRAIVSMINNNKDKPKDKEAGKISGYYREILAESEKKHAVWELQTRALDLAKECLQKEIARHKRTRDRILEKLNNLFPPEVLQNTKNGETNHGIMPDMSYLKNVTSDGLCQVMFTEKGLIQAECESALENVKSDLEIMERKLEASAHHAFIARMEQSVDRLNGEKK